MKSLFSEDAVTEIKSRLEHLSTSHKPQWGKMNVSQMLTHCQFPLQVAVGDLKLQRPNAFKRALFSMFKSSLYNDKPWKQGLPTAKEFVVTTDTEFAPEKSKLLTEIDKFHAKKTQTQWPEHPMFGKFNSEQWGQMQYKHLDHHLKQFGV